MLLEKILKNISLFVIYFYLLALSTCTLVYGQLSESYGDQLVIGFVGKTPQVINPFQINNIPEKYIVRLIFGTGLQQSLNRFGQTRSLMEKYKPPTSSEDQGRVWRYVLLRNVILHNGQSLRNQDVKFTFEMIKKYGGYVLNKKYDFSEISAIELIGDLEFSFILNRKEKFFDEKLSGIPMLSQTYYQKLINNGYSSFENLPPIGYGPFRLESKSESAVSLVSHQSYVFGGPFLNRIVFRFFDNEQQLIDAFIQGQVDLMEVQTSITARRLHQILVDQVRVFIAPRPEKKVYFMLFNVNRFPFNNSIIRSAVSAGIHQDRIAKSIVEPHGHVAYSIVDYTNPFFMERLYRNTFQPENSMRILQGEGWQINSSKGTLVKNGNDFVFDLLFEENSYDEENIARAVKIQLSELGINVQPKPVNIIEKNNLVKENNFTAVITEFSYYDDDIYEVIKTFYLEVLRNIDTPLNYTSSEIDRLLRQAEANSAVRRQFIQNFLLRIQREAPAVFFFFDDRIIYAVNYRFQKVNIPFSGSNNHYYRLNPFENWFVPKSLQKY